ncbi:MAG: pyrroline-5-carboxylate reductase [Planctomycetaceae bacterium]
MQLQDAKIGFIGTGRMATALAAGFTRELVSPDRIFGTDPVAASREQFVAAVGASAHVDASPETCLNSTDIVFLCVKPQVMRSMLEDIEALLTGPAENLLLVSIAAGLTIANIESWLPRGCRLIRVMPNTPCLIGRGASGISRGTYVTEQDEQMVVELLRTVSVVERLPEKLLDAVTGLSGCGPAYVFQMIEALSDGGVSVGLPRDIATRLAAQTLAGAAEMVLQTGDHPAALKDAVTSPGGSTIIGIHQMEMGGVRAALMNAVRAATVRSQELGQ